MNHFMHSLRMLLAATLILGFGYTGIVTVGAKLFCGDKAQGSLLTRKGQLVGSELIAQKFTQPGYFWPRPSAADYATVASGASNQGALSASLKSAIDVRRGSSTQPDMLMASGSGLDPHISPAAAQDQVARIASARKLAPERIATLVERLQESPSWGFMGEPRVNVLLLNIALDDLVAGESKP